MTDRRNALLRHRRTLLGAAIACLVVPAWSQIKPPVAGARKIVVGQSVPLTGAASEIGLAFAGGAKLFFDAHNGRKDNVGFTFELKQLDDGYVAKQAGDNAKKMLTDGADVLFGFVGTASSDAAAAVAKAEGATLFGPFAASDTLRGADFPTVFHVRPSLADEAMRMVRHTSTLGQNRIAVLAEDDAMGRAGLAAVNAAIAELKLPPLVASAFVPANSDKVDAAVAELAKAQPQAIIQVALFNTTAAFIRKMRKTGYAGGFLNFSVVGIDPLFTALAKRLAVWWSRRWCLRRAARPPLSSRNTWPPLTTPTNRPAMKAWRASLPPKRWQKLCVARARGLTRPACSAP